MVSIIGSGMAFLRDWAHRCKAAGGIPQVVTKYGGKRWSEITGQPGAVLVRCYGAGRKVKGGLVTHIPEDFIEKAEREVGELSRLIGA